PPSQLHEHTGPVHTRALSNERPDDPPPLAAAKDATTTRVCAPLPDPGQQSPPNRPHRPGRAPDRATTPPTAPSCSPAPTTAPSRRRPPTTGAPIHTILRNIPNHALLPQTPDHARERTDDSATITISLRTGILGPSTAPSSQPHPFAPVGPPARRH